VQEKVDATKEALKTDDIEKIKDTSSALSDTIQKVGQELYAASAADKKEEAQDKKEEEKETSENKEEKTDKENK